MWSPFPGALTATGFAAADLAAVDSATGFCEDFGMAAI
jgi:hypothetical protein